MTGDEKSVPTTSPLPNTEFRLDPASLMVVQKAIDALQIPLGTPVVAVDTEGKPTALGLHLSGDATKRPSELKRFATLAFEHSEQAGLVATAISSGLDVATDLHPTWLNTANEAGSVFAFVATGLELGHAIQERDKGAISAAGFRFGANVLDLVDKSGLLGVHPTLHTVVLFAKSGGTVVDLIVPASKK